MSTRRLRRASSVAGHAHSLFTAASVHTSVHNKIPSPQPPPWPWAWPYKSSGDVPAHLPISSSPRYRPPPKLPTTRSLPSSEPARSPPQPSHRRRSVRSHGESRHGRRVVRHLRPRLHRQGQPRCPLLPFALCIFFSHAARSPARPAPNSGLARGVPSLRFACSGGSSCEFLCRSVGFRLLKRLNSPTSSSFSLISGSRLGELCSSTTVLNRFSLVCRIQAGRTST